MPGSYVPPNPPRRCLRPMDGPSFAPCYGCAYDEDSPLARHPQQDRAVDVVAESRLGGPQSDRAPYGFLTYSSAPDQPLLGVPIMEGGLWSLSSQQKFEAVAFSLYVNGFTYFTPEQGEASVSLSPFSLVRNCRFQSDECAALKSFKISDMDHEPCSYFAALSRDEHEAEAERSDWVLGISHAILLVTDSILPPFAATCDPIPGVPHTARRLLAGYLVHRDDTRSVSVVYCELRAHASARAQLVLYENELCQAPVHEIVISESSMCTDIIGINCTCFAVNSHYFASQTPSERKLWLRAISNVKVKLHTSAPDPTEEELWHFRKSIRESIRAIHATVEPTPNSEALLVSCPGKGIGCRVRLRGGCEPFSEVPSEYEAHEAGSGCQVVML